MISDNIMAIFGVRQMLARLKCRRPDENPLAYVHTHQRRAN